MIPDSRSRMQLGISVEQFILQQENSMKNSMYTMLESFGMNVQSEAMDDFLDPLISEYLKSVATKVPALYKDLYSDDEILALYNFMKTKEGISINKKQSLMMEKTMFLIRFYCVSQYVFSSKGFGEA